MILNKNDVKFINSIDNIGQIFFWQDRVFRAINDNQASKVKELLYSGLIDELVRNGLFPETTVSEDICIEGFSLILEHKKIPYITVSSEWSFHMLKDVCMAYLKVIKICNKFGYSLKDGHLYNITFFNNKPIFFDFGSIVREKNDSGLFEFYLRAVIPLQVWSKGDFYLASLILRDEGSHTRFLPSTSLEQQKILHPILSSFREKSTSRFIRRAINYLSRRLFKKNIVSPPLLTCEKLTQIINKIEQTKFQTAWSNYHDEFFSGININSTPRFDRIIELLNSLNLSSMIDLAGNKGAFSLLVAQKTNIPQILCTDYDESVIDSLYLFVKNNNITKVLPILLNFIYPIPLGEFSNQRLKADIAVALAITHHVLLAQSIQIDDVLRKIGMYSNHFVLIEFMPLGLWDGKNAQPNPAYYTTEWFREKFQEQFTLLIEEQTEPNRIFFLGEKIMNANN